MEKKELNCRAEEQAKRERMRMEIVASLSADLIFEVFCCPDYIFAVINVECRNLVLSDQTVKPGNYSIKIMHNIIACIMCMARIIACRGRRKSRHRADCQRAESCSDQRNPDYG